MLATVILGIVIAALFINGLRIIYKNFFKAEPACCDSGGCPHCAMNKNNGESCHACTDTK